MNKTIINLNIDALIQYVQEARQFFDSLQEYEQNHNANFATTYWIEYSDDILKALTEGKTLPEGKLNDLFIRQMIALNRANETLEAIKSTTQDENVLDIIRKNT